MSPLRIALAGACFVLAASVVVAQSNDSTHEVAASFPLEPEVRADILASAAALPSIFQSEPEIGKSKTGLSGPGWDQAIEEWEYGRAIAFVAAREAAEQEAARRAEEEAARAAQEAAERAQREVAAPAPTPAPVASSGSCGGMWDLFVAYFGSNAGGMCRVVACESGFNPTARNTRSSAAGLFQFLSSTQAAYGDPQYASAADAPVESQFAAAARLFNDRGYSPWVCRP